MSNGSTNIIDDNNNCSAAGYSSEINIHMLKCCNYQHTWCENCMSNGSTNIIDDKNISSAAEHSSEINIHMLKCCNCQHT